MIPRSRLAARSLRTRRTSVPRRRRSESSLPGGVAGEEVALQKPRLLACPFCGGPPAWEAHAGVPEAVRISCPGPRCGVRPHTEYLLGEFAEELAACWNARGARPHGHPSARDIGIQGDHA